PSVGAPVLSTATVVVGHSVSLTVTVKGGAGGNVITWSGLPDHCSVGAIQASCVPTVPGPYYISVDLKDANGALASSNVSLLTVATSAPNPGGQDSGGIAGGSGTIAYAVVGGFLALVVVVAVLVYRYRAPPPKRSKAARPRPARRR
ncbi:MAG TPA: hypothetical protein VLY85_03135, partial [Thermoplasmata archaeon]|nr:hypothetical protein [Thermoplasmata archaeon]